MLHSVRARMLGSFALLGLALLLGLGGGLFVILRDLNLRAEEGALTQAMVPFIANARAAITLGTPLGTIVDRLNDTAADSGVVAFIVNDAGLPLATSSAFAPPAVAVPPADRRNVMSRGTFPAGGVRYVYVSATLYANRAPQGARALVLAHPDVAAASALGDLARAMAVAALIVLVVGAILATILARSISRPLERLAGATRDVGRGALPPPLPLVGPAEVARASESFNLMTAEVAHGRRAQADLLAGLRHDLRTPLTVIGGYAQALQDGTATGPDATRAIAAIADETARLERMVDDLAALTDLDLGGRPLRLEQLDAGELAREAAGRFAVRAEAAGQLVAGPGEVGSLPVVADRTALERILGNLVANALNAAPRPGGHVRIEAAALPGGAVMLAVRDDGPGIPPAALPRVFERFFRVDPARFGTGSGLGLAIVAELARAHGGRAFAENQAGGGARVGIVLPTAPPAALPSARPALASTGPGAA